MKNFKLLSALLLLSGVHITLSSNAPLESNKTEKDATATAAEEPKKFRITDHESIKMNCDDQSSIASYRYKERNPGMYITGGDIRDSKEQSALLVKFNKLSPYMKFNDLSFGKEIGVTVELSPLCQVQEASQSRVKATCENGTREIYFELRKHIHDPNRKLRQTIQKLESAKRRAIQEQDFELAAALRDKIRALEQQNYYSH